MGQIRFSKRRQDDPKWADGYENNLYSVDKTVDCKNFAYKKVKIEFKCKNQDQLGFCGMQNMIIIWIFDCDSEYQFDQFNYDTNRNLVFLFLEIKQLLEMRNMMMVTIIYLMDVFIVNINLKKIVKFVLEGNVQNHRQQYILFYIYILQEQIIIYHMILIQYNSLAFYIVIFEQMIIVCNVHKVIIQIKQKTYVKHIVQTLFYKVMNNVMMVICDGCSNCKLIQYQLCDDTIELSKQHCSVCHLGKFLNVKMVFQKMMFVFQFVEMDYLIKQKKNVTLKKIKDVQIVKFRKDTFLDNQTFLFFVLVIYQCTKCTTFNNVSLLCLSCIDGSYPIEDKCFQCDTNCIICIQQSNMCMCILNYTFYYTSCFRNDCNFCESTPGLIADIKSKQCISICGDGIQFQFYEQCDDHNQIDGDGSDSQCYLEYFNEDLKQIKSYYVIDKNTYDLKLINISEHIYFYATIQMLLQKILNLNITLILPNKLMAQLVNYTFIS
ncbi:unnamed protein product [Paramecium primaurelia]|uniref:Transmembrane protein n=1 Tax=Paramecium primaurelia TaxID=5886 RepID=A0A8S1P165_PARPR|nr:unnamed protein product [Paramecium primaurelia]